MTGIYVQDVTLRDGMHAVSHGLSTGQARDIAAALDAAGVAAIEVAHGDGLAGGSLTYGAGAHSDAEWISAVADVVNNARLTTLLLPGIGTVTDLRAAADLGVTSVRIATHCTEADISVQHFGLARDRGLETVGFLMMAHSITPAELAEQARIMADAGCQCVYVVDSAGALVLDQVSDRVAALVAELGDDAQVGFHGHENLGLGVANSVLAVRAGATQIDGSTRRFGAGAGNTPVEAFVGVCDKLGIRTGVDFFAITDAAEDVVRPAMLDECRLDRLALIMGYAGVYSSFLVHAYNLAQRYDVSGAEILVRAGERRLVGGQEDQLIDIAVELRQEAAGR
jgi:4-hydroxy 2-oxovalerate aldolase